MKHHGKSPENCPHCSRPLETREPRCPYCDSVLIDSALFMDESELDEIAEELRHEGGGGGAGAGGA